MQHQDERRSPSLRDTKGGAQNNLSAHSIDSEGEGPGNAEGTGAFDEDSERVAKVRKNERERQRRLAVSEGFDELFRLLKLPQSEHVDKISILRRAISRVKELEARVATLERMVEGAAHVAAASSSNNNNNNIHSSSSSSS